MRYTKNLAVELIRLPEDIMGSYTFQRNILLERIADKAIEMYADPDKSSLWTGVHEMTAVAMKIRDTHLQCLDHCIHEEFHHALKKIRNVNELIDKFNELEFAKALQKTKGINFPILKIQGCKTLLPHHINMTLNKCVAGKWNMAPSKRDPKPREAKKE